MAKRWHGWGIFLVVVLPAGSVWAETIELVTYYPAPSTPDQHVRSLTVGTPYATQNNLNDGDALVYRRLWVGPGFDAAAEFQLLTVEGNVWARSPATALFIADRGANTNYSGLQLKTFGVAQWTIGSRNDGTEHLQIYSDADSAIRMFIQQGTGSVGIGTTAPAGRLHVVGADDSLSQVLFTAGQDLVPGAPFPDIRVGIGTETPNSRLDVRGSMSLGVTIVTGNPSPLLLTDAHNVVLTNGTGNLTITLPSAANRAGRTYYIKKTDGDADLVTINAAGGALIDGAASLVLYVQNDAARVTTDGFNWFVISNEIRLHMARMIQPVVQPIPIQVWQKVNFTEETYDVGGIASTDTDQFTIRRSGKYQVSASWFLYSNQPVTWSGLQIYVNGAAVLYSFETSMDFGNAYLSAVDTLNLAAGDYVEMYIAKSGDSGPPRVYSADAPRMSVTELRY